MSKEQLLAELTRSRVAIAQDYAVLRRELDFAAKLSLQISRNPAPWIIGATGLGWILAGSKTKTRVVHKPLLTLESHKVKAGGDKAPRAAGALAFVLAAARFLYPYFKPTITDYAGRRFSELAGRRRAVRPSRPPA